MPGCDSQQTVRHTQLGVYSLCACIHVAAQLMAHNSCEAAVDAQCQIWVGRIFKSLRVFMLLPSWMAACILLYLCMDNRLSAALL